MGEKEWVNGKGQRGGVENLYDKVKIVRGEFFEEQGEDFPLRYMVKLCVARRGTS